MLGILASQDARAAHGDRPDPHHALVLCKPCDSFVDLIPPWLRAVAPINPLTYLVDPLRGFTIVGGKSVHGFAIDFAMLITVFVALLIIAVKLYPTLAE